MSKRKMPARSGFHTVYVLFDIDGVPRWIGCTKQIERRIREHTRERAWLYAHTLIHTNIAYKIALDYEATLIEAIGRAPKGPLYNRAAKHNAQGVIRPIEHRLAIAARMQGNLMSQETRNKLSVALKGRTLSVETRAKMSASRTGRTLSDAHKAATSAGRKGIVFSAEHRRKLSEAQQRRYNKEKKK